MATPVPFARRILLAVTGLSPQVVTETLYALSQEDIGQIPTEVHLLTTLRGFELARLNLLSDDPGWFHRLCRDYRLPPIRFTESHIHVLRDRKDKPLADIRTPEDNEDAADFIAAQVAELCADPHTAVHVSIAGGRKTMGYYAGYALSLYGRPQDRLSHVLVEDPFESHPQFYYPTPYSRVIYTHDHEQRPLDCRSARVWLAQIPFVRLREELPERLLQGRLSFTEACAWIERSLSPPRLVLEVANNKVYADNQPISLTPTEFALLWWFADQALNQGGAIDWSQPQAGDTFLSYARRVMGEMSSDFERCEKAIRERRDDPKLLAAYFDPHRTRTHKAFENVLGHRAAQRYAIENVGTRGAARYALRLSPNDIDIRIP